MADSESLVVNQRIKKKKKRSNELQFKSDEIDPMEITERVKNIKREYEESFSSERKKIRGKSKKHVSLSKEEKDLKELILPQKISYFMKILEAFKSDVQQQDKSLFVLNALQESEGLEVELSCDRIAGHCIELLLSYCEDPSVWIKFMTAYSKQKEIVCTNANASHIAELLIHYAVQSIQNWSSILETEEDNKVKEYTSFFLSWITELGDFFSCHFIDCLGNRYASHVACSIIRALGGHITHSTDFRSKNSLNHKKEFSSEYASEGVVVLSSVTLEKIPKWFKRKLKHISKFACEITNICGYCSESYSATVFQTLALVLEKRSSKHFSKFVCKFSAALFSEKNNKGVPLAFFDEHCSFIIEKLFQVASEENQRFLWDEYFKRNSEFLVTHRIGNYVIQRAFDEVKEKYTLMVMCGCISTLFDKVLESKHYGIFISMATACTRLKMSEAIFMTSLMSCFECSEPEERQSKLVPLLLSLKKYGDYNSELQVCLQGSLLVQKLFSFQKPIKLVKSLISMKPEQLFSLACHEQGCYVLTAFFKSSTVGDKNKDKLIQCLQPVMINLGCDKSGNLTLSRIWVMLNIKQKGAICDILGHDQEKLKSNKYGNSIFNKFRVFHYKYRYEQWKDFQLQLVQNH